MPDDFEQMWSDLAPLGRSASSGGYFRQPFTSVEILHILLQGQEPPKDEA